MLMFLKAVGEAVVAKALKVVTGFVPFGDVIYEVGEDVIERYRKANREAKLATDAQEAISAKMEVIREEAKQIAREVAAGESAEVIELVEAYLTLVPAAITQSLKRANDPTGTTLPFGFAIHSAEDVARMLPPRVPRFRPAMPVPGKPGWTLDHLLGVGSFGEVWLARHGRMASLTGAVKFCFGQTARDLIHEADLIDRIMQAGSHPNIVPLKDVHLEGDAPWIMFDYVAGGTLADWIHTLAGKPNETRLPEVLTAIRQLADAVAFFHALPRPVVHRDLKLSNILFDLRTNALRVTDFGIGSVVAKDAERTATRGVLQGQFLGSHTPVYSSPQQRRGDPAHPRDDVHALGVIAYQMLTGKVDAGPGPGAMRALKRIGVGDEIADLVLRCASEESEDRPADGVELTVALAVAIGIHAASAVPIPVETIQSATAQHEPVAQAEVVPVAEAETPPTLSANGDSSNTATVHRCTGLRLLFGEAEDGNVAAMLTLGEIHEQGRGIFADFGEAMYWYRSASNLGSVAAKKRLAYLLLHRPNRIPLYESAFHLNLEAALLGDVEAMWQVANCYSLGLGVQRSPLEAVRWLMSAAKNKHLESMKCCIRIYSQGLGTKVDPGKASAWLRECASQGDPESTFRLGLLDHSPKLRQQAAEAGWAPAMYNLGLGYLSRATGRESRNQAISWLCKAAEEGVADAMTALGDLYSECKFEGWNLPLALEWYEKAAKAGSPRGMYVAGQMYLSGVAGAQDRELGLSWLRKASDGGSSDASQMLARLLRKGYKWLPADPDQSLEYLTRAANAGHERAMEQLARVSFGSGLPFTL